MVRLALLPDSPVVAVERDVGPVVETVEAPKDVVVRQQDSQLPVKRSKVRPLLKIVAKCIRDIKRKRFIVLHLNHVLGKIINTSQWITNEQASMTQIS